MNRSIDDAPWDQELEGFAAEQDLAKFFNRNPTTLRRWRLSNLNVDVDYVEHKKPKETRARIYWSRQPVERYAATVLGWGAERPKVPHKATVTRVSGSGRWVMTNLGKVYVKRSPFWCPGLEIEVVMEESGAYTCPRAPRRKWKY